MSMSQRTDALCSSGRSAPRPCQQPQDRIRRRSARHAAGRGLGAAARRGGVTGVRTGMISMVPGMPREEPCSPRDMWITRMPW